MDSGGEQNREGVLYRIEIGGNVPISWQERFGAEAIHVRGENTVLEIRVRDQSELFGRLRRIHDLNLPLISMARVDPEEKMDRTGEGTSGLAREQ